MKALLVLEDGTHFMGTSIGASGEVFGEVVFNTSMTGYQEVLTDPSYKGQIVAMTYPLIGNYGVNYEDVESARPRVEGFIVRELTSFPSNWRAKGSLRDYLGANSIVGIQEIDTRALTRHIRSAGAMKGAISTVDLDPRTLCERARGAPGLIGRDLVVEVTCATPYVWPETGERKFDLVCYDLGVKHNILRNLSLWGCRMTVVPAATPAGDVLKLPCDGVVFSNGPGDPAGVPYAARAARELIGKKPFLGICLGHQILGIVLGLSTFKLKFGHRGANQPVRNIKTGRVEITAQNHGFAVAVPHQDGRGTEVEVTHVNLNDGTLEGLRHHTLPAVSVQFHPEASPGPHDARPLFAEFLKMIEKF